jgi:hypothetical protein
MLSSEGKEDPQARKIRRQGRSAGNKGDAIVRRQERSAGNKRDVIVRRQGRSAGNKGDAIVRRQERSAGNKRDVIVRRQERSAGIKRDAISRWSCQEILILLLFVRIIFRQKRCVFCNKILCVTILHQPQCTLDPVCRNDFKCSAPLLAI